MKISAIIPTFKRRDKTFEAVKSILAQSLGVEEIVVVEDGGIECADIGSLHPCIKYISKSNEGVSSARNRGIKEAKNEWIALLDSDDLWLEKKIEIQVEALKKSQHLICFSDEIWLRNEVVVNKPKFYDKGRKDVFEASLTRTFLPPSSALIHTSVFETIGLFDESYEVCEDYEMWLRVLANFEITLLKEKLVIKRAGEWEALSKRGFLDKWRIEAIEKNLNIFTHKQRDLALQELMFKKRIVQKGAMKRLR
ncbi:MAG: glycosyltransferase family 2 protein [Campylobacterales bacterium]